MRIYTEVIFKWDDKQNKLIETSSESFDYEGPMALCDVRETVKTWVGEDGKTYRHRWRRGGGIYTIKANFIDVQNDDGAWVNLATEGANHGKDWSKRWAKDQWGIEASAEGIGSSQFADVDAYKGWWKGVYGITQPSDEGLRDRWVAELEGLSEDEKAAKIAIVEQNDGRLEERFWAEEGSEDWYDYTLTEAEQAEWHKDDDDEKYIPLAEWQEKNYGTEEWLATIDVDEQAGYVEDPETGLYITTAEWEEKYPEELTPPEAGTLEWFNASTDSDSPFYNANIAERWELDEDNIPKLKAKYTEGTTEWFEDISDPLSPNFDEDEAVLWELTPGGLERKPDYDAPSIGQAKMADAIKSFTNEWTKIATVEKASDTQQQAIQDALEAVELKEGEVATAFSDLEAAKEGAQGDYEDAIALLMGGEIDGEEIAGSYYTALTDISDDYDNMLADIKEEYTTKTGEAGTTRDVSLEDEAAFRESNLQASRETAKGLISAADAKIASRGFASTGVGKTAREMLSAEIGEGATEIQEEYEKQRTRIKEGHTEALDIIKAEWSHEKDDEGAFIGTKMRDLEKEYGEEGRLETQAETNRVVALKQYLNKRDEDIDDEMKLYRSLSNQYDYLLDHYGAEKSGDKYLLKGVRGGTVEEAQEYLKTVQSDLLTTMQLVSTQMIQESEGTLNELPEDYFYDPFADITSPLHGQAEEYGWKPYADAPGGSFEEGIEALGEYGLKYATEVIGGLAYEPGEGLQLFSDFTDDEGVYTPDWAWTYEPEDE